MNNFQGTDNIVNDLTGIVIVNYNTFTELIECVESIHNKVSEKYKIYIVENGSRPEIQKKIISTFSKYKDVEVLVSDINLGYSGGNNLGIKKAVEDGTEYILIVNSDVEFNNDVIHYLKEDLVNDVAVAGPHIINLSGKEGQQLIRTYSTMSAFLDRMPFYYLKKYLHLYLLDSAKIHEPFDFFGMVQGSCFIIKAKTFKDLGYFDENVFLYSEERILSIKLKEQRIKTCYDPRAEILHKEGKSTKKTGNPFADYHRYVSDYYTIKKYCPNSRIGNKLVKWLRIINFRLKAKRDKDYQWYYLKMLEKFEDIDSGNYKIEATMKR